MSSKNDKSRIKDTNQSKNKELESIFHGATLFIFGKIANNGLGFVLNILLTRGLGATSYGVYAYAQTIVVSLITFTHFGSNQSVLRFLPEYKNKRFKQEFILTLSYLTSTIGSVSVAIILYSFSSLISRHTLDMELLVVVLQLFSILLIFDCLIKLVVNIFRSLELPGFQILIGNVLEPLVRVVCVAIAFVLGFGFVGVMSSIVIGSSVVLVTAFVMMFYRVPLKPSLNTKNKRDQAVEFYKFSLPLTLKDASDIIYKKSDVFMIGLFLSSSTVGIYNISVLLTGVLSIPRMAFNQLFPPIASKLYSNDELGELQEIYSIVTRWSFTTVLFLGITMALYREELLFIFGEEFTAGSLVLVIFIVGQIFYGVAGPSNYMLMMTGHQNILFINQFSFAVTNIVLNYILIIRFGMTGAAIATVIVFATLNIIQIIEIWHFENIHPYSMSFFKPIVASAVAAVSMFLVGELLYGLFSIIVGGIIGVAIFISTLILLGIEEEDREFVISLVG